MSIYSPLLSAGAGWVWFVCTLVSVFLIITISRHLCCLFLPQEREPWTVSPALTCEEGKVLACLERAHHRSMLLFHSKWEKLLFFPRRNKICNRKKKEKTTQQQNSHIVGEAEAKQIYYSGSSASSLVHLLFRHATEVVSSIFPHSGEFFFKLVSFMPYWPHAQLFHTSHACYCTVRLGQLAQLL